jgi:subtilase family serine protease
VVVVQEKPDLVITKVWHEYTGTKFLEDTTIYYTIKNNGEGAAGASTRYMSWYYGGKLISTDNVQSLAPGQTRTESFSTYTLQGVFDINICADGSNKIAETDETNNCNRYYTLG